jgi:uncharacterized protein YuzE
VRISYDKEVNAAYISLRERIGVGGVKKTVPVDNDINLDFDSEDRLVGIEVLAASDRLPAEVLSEAE